MRFFISDGLGHASKTRVSSGLLAVLQCVPFSCRKALGGDGNPFLRELIIPFGASGYVALFEIENRDTVTVLAVRQQREADYH